LEAPNDSMHHGKPEAAARKLCGEERVEDLGLRFRRHAATRVADFQLQIIARGYGLRDRLRLPYGYVPCSDADNPVAISEGVRRIDDEVHHNLAKLCGAGPDRREILAEIGHQGHVAGNRDLEQPQHSLYGFGSIDRFQDVTLS